MHFKETKLKFENNFPPEKRFTLLLILSPQMVCERKRVMMSTVVQED